MKKTLIALLALSSVSMATVREADITATTKNEFNNAWATTLASVEWAEGADFTLTLTLTDGEGSFAFMKLANDRYLISQLGGRNNDHDNIYFGTNTQENNNLPDGWANKFTFSKDGDTYIMTEKDSSPLASWSLNSTGTGSATRAWGDALTLTIDSKAATGTTITFAYASDTIVDTFVLPNTSLNLSDFAILKDVTFNGHGHLSVVPEPATATLSLLALAGLAARRRRH